MCTRNRFLPVLLLILAASTLAGLTAPVANARMLPPQQAVIVDPGDPDEPIDARSSAAPPSSGEPARPADSFPQICAPHASVLKVEATPMSTLDEATWQVREVLRYLLFQSPILR
jgi:hypothetical protein